MTAGPRGPDRAAPTGRHRPGLPPTGRPPTGAPRPGAGRAAAAAAAVVLTLAGCSGGGGVAGTPGTPGPVAPASTAPPATAAPPVQVVTPGPSGAPAPETPSPAETDLGPAPSTPAATAGTLSRTSLPRLAALGAGWRYRIGGTDAEEGFVGNGSPAVARDPGDVLLALLPLGCPGPRDLPRPRAALEVTYRHAPTGVQAVGLRLSFASAAVAGRFAATYRARMQACAAVVDPATGRAFVRAVASSGDAAAPGSGAALPAGVAYERVEPADPTPQGTWTEVVVGRGRDVVYLAVNAPAADTPLAPARAAAAAAGVLG